MAVGWVRIGISIRLRKKFDVGKTSGKAKLGNFQSLNIGRLE